MRRERPLALVRTNPSVTFEILVTERLSIGGVKGIANLLALG